LAVPIYHITLEYLNYLITLSLEYLNTLS